MTKSLAIDTIRTRFQGIETQLNSTFVKRNDVIRTMLLAYLTGQHFILVGPPGTGKTAAINCFMQHVTDARTFGILMGSFTAPEKVFGPLDISAYKKGKYEYVTEGKLPEVEFATLDEVMKSNDGTLNSLLEILNERRFEGTPVPLMSVAAASNWPEIDSRSDNVLALYDRFILRCQVQDLKDKADVVAVLRASDSLAKGYAPQDMLTVADIKVAIDSVKQVEITDDVRTIMHAVRSRLVTRKTANGRDKPGIDISSRRLGKLQDILRAQAWLSGNSEVGIEDFHALRFGLWNDRKDLELVDTVLGSLDDELVSEISELIDETRQEYRNLKTAGYPMVQLNTVFDKIKTVAAEVKLRTGKPVFTKNGRAKVNRAIKGMRADFVELQAHVSKQKGGVS